jgi:hypothetical protein
MNNFSQIMDERFYPYLGKRENTFRMVFDYLNSLDKDKYLIVETGTTRYENNITDDGSSTIMFDFYCNTEKNGLVYTVDISPSACELVRSQTSPKTIVCLNDSVKFLSTFPNPEDIDLLYLDSFDLDWDNPHPSSLHHLKELTAVYSKLKPGCLIVVDDNHRGLGKGQYVVDFLNSVNDKIYFDEYQIGYIKL